MRAQDSRGISPLSEGGRPNNFGVHGRKMANGLTAWHPVRFQARSPSVHFGGSSP
ncbi:MAG: hypothetical protein QOF48_1297 [Verrucomicrobiota bacterium]